MGGKVRKRVLLCGHGEGCTRPAVGWFFVPFLTYAGAGTLNRFCRRHARSDLGLPGAQQVFSEELPEIPAPARGKRGEEESNG